MNLPLDRPVAPATTTDQFARAVRNSALTSLDKKLRAARSRWEEVGPVHLPTLFLRDALEALDVCLVELERADRFAPELPGGVE